MKVLSLGCHCEVAHQLRRLGIKASSPFDWLVTPFESVLEIITDRGTKLGRDFVVDLKGTSVRCRHYDVFYHHEFPRDEAEHIIFNVDALEQARSRLARKMTRFIDQCEGSEPVIFVRVGPRSGSAWEGKEVFSPAHVWRLMNTIASAFPSLRFGLLLITRPGFGRHDLKRVTDERVKIVESQPIPQGSLGYDAEWDQLNVILENHYSALFKAAKGAKP